MLSRAKVRSMPYRIGPRRHVSRGGCMARISEDARRNVVFLGWDASTADDPSAMKPGGTGFLIHCGEGGYQGVYLVTAAHIARDLGGDPFVIRMNDENGQARLDHIDQATWYCHPDCAVDVALMRYEPPDWSSGVVLPVSEFLDSTTSAGLGNWRGRRGLLNRAVLSPQRKAPKCSGSSRGAYFPSAIRRKNTRRRSRRRSGSLFSGDTRSPGCQRVTGHGEADAAASCS